MQLVALSTPLTGSLRQGVKEGGREAPAVKSLYLRPKYTNHVDSIVKDCQWISEKLSRSRVESAEPVLTTG